jgi:hypothetical protein
MADEERKIIIDEDWKAQVQREREKARAEAEAHAKPALEPSAEEDEGTGEAVARHEPVESPFQGLVATLAAQAMYALGMIAAPDSHEVMVDLPTAKAVIDMLMALRQKTKGNLTPDEEGHLTEVLSELQRFYALRARQMTEATLKQSGIDPRTGQPQQ